MLAVFWRLFEKSFLVVSRYNFTSMNAATAQPEIVAI